jgi:hypothetical protein
MEGGYGFWTYTQTRAKQKKSQDGLHSTDYSRAEDLRIISQHDSPCFLHHYIVKAYICPEVEQLSRSRMRNTCWQCFGFASEVRIRIQLHGS